jgi:Zn-dependent protease
MSELQTVPPSSPVQSPPPSTLDRVRKAAGPIGIALLVVVKFFGKIKFLLLPIMKFALPVVKTGGTMVLSIGVYAMSWGWKFALGFVLLIFVHELGHLIAARRMGLPVGAPVFIPFMGAFIALKEAPKNAWIEAYVGAGGPVLGAIGALLCEVIFLLTGNPMFRALAYTGFLLNLFNLAPVGFLDGGRIVTALSPWLWIVGFVVMSALLVMQPSLLLGLILVLSLPRIFSLFRAKTDEERRFYEVTPRQRMVMGAVYFGLIGLLVAGMAATHIAVER